MLVNRHHLPWIFIVLLATLVVGIFYLAALHPDRLPFPVELPEILQVAPGARPTPGGSPLGLILGGVSLAIFIFAALLGMRKKKRLWKIGHVQIWLRAHIWLTILTIPFVAFHCDFHRGGPMTTWLLVLYAFVMLSGFYGLALQQVIPRLMKEWLPSETVFEQIPYVRGLLVAEAEALQEKLLPPKEDAKKPATQKTASTPSVSLVPLVPTDAPTSDDTARLFFSAFIDSDVLPYLKARRGDRMKLGRPTVADNLFRLLQLRLPEDLRALAADCQNWCDERRRMDLQTRLHHWLHGWLILHVPTSLLLILFTAWHAIVTVFYY